MSIGLVNFATIAFSLLIVSHPSNMTKPTSSTSTCRTMCARPVRSPTPDPAPAKAPKSKAKPKNKAQPAATSPAKAPSDGTTSSSQLTAQEAAQYAALTKKLKAAENAVRKEKEKGMFTTALTYDSDIEFCSCSGQGGSIDEQPKQ
jgi:hypothetical protein